MCFFFIPGFYEGAVFFTVSRVASNLLSSSLILLNAWIAGMHHTPYTYMSARARTHTIVCVCKQVCLRMYNLFSSCLMEPYKRVARHPSTG